MPNSTFAVSKIAVLAVDSLYPNLALMKIAAYHRQRGDMVNWYNPFDEYDRLYAAKVFSFTPDYGYYINNIHGDIIKGGTGYDITSRLHDEIDTLQPDYSIYPQIDARTSYGFLTRGCIRACPWCIVPRKEGTIHPYMDIDDITLHGQRPYAVLMDNNILACGDYGANQLEKIATRGYHVDFNQGLDARLVDDVLAALLARIKWIKRIRFGCDTPGQVAECERAIERISSYGYRGEFFLYCIITDDLNESYARIDHWRGLHNVVPFAQPFRDPMQHSRQIPKWQKDMARWANRKELYRSCSFMDFEPRKGFLCSDYFK